MVLDLTIVTGKDWLRDDGHGVIFAALSPVISSCPETDMLILADWTSNDYGIFLELVYSQTERYYQYNHFTYEFIELHIYS